MKHFHSYCLPNNLYYKFDAGLGNSGSELSTFGFDVLQAVDKSNIRGEATTMVLIEFCCFTPDMHILEPGTKRLLMQDIGSR